MMKALIAKSGHPQTRLLFATEASCSRTSMRPLTCCRRRTRFEYDVTRSRRPSLLSSSSVPYSLLHRPNYDIIYHSQSRTWSASPLSTPATDWLLPRCAALPAVASHHLSCHHRSLSINHPISVCSSNHQHSFTRRYKSRSSYTPHYGLEIENQPLPDIESSLDHFLEHARVAMSPDEFGRLDLLRREFVQSGRALKLLERFKEETNNHTNWSYKYWLRDMYLRNPVSLPLMSNASMVIARHTFTHSDDWLRHTALFVVGLLKVRETLINNQLPLDYVRTLPGSKSGQGAVVEKQAMCMDQYTACISSYRRPGQHCDQQIRYSVNLDPAEPTYLIVARNGQFFSLKVGCSGGEIIGSECLFGSLKQIYHGSAGLSEGGGANQGSADCVGVGVATAADRPKWANIYQQLCQSGVNRQSLHQMESSFCLLCLDESEPVPGLQKDQEGHGEASSVHEIHLRQLALGGNRNNRNRWYDKALQIVTSADGFLGINVEHSIAEGIVWLRMVHLAQNWMRNEIEKNSRTSQSNSVQTKTEISSNEILGCPKPVIWDVDSPIKEQLQEVEHHFHRSASDVRIQQVILPGVNKNTIKSASINPDVFVQLMLQLAYYRTHGSLCHSYESASMRRFDRGRADNIRSNNETTLKLAQMLTDQPHTSKSDLLQQLRKACDVQQKQIDLVISGYGSDMILQSLKDFCREKNIQDDFLMSPEFSATFNFKLTTSQVSCGPGAEHQFWYYGPVSADGYGVCYHIRAHSICLCVSSFHSSECSRHDNFVSQLFEAKDMLLSLIVC